MGDGHGEERGKGLPGSGEKGIGGDAVAGEERSGLAGAQGYSLTGHFQATERRP